MVCVRCAVYTRRPLLVFRDNCARPAPWALAAQRHLTRIGCTVQLIVSHSVTEEFQMSPEDPLAVAREELLQAIGKLEVFVEDLRDEKKEVPTQLLEELRGIRRTVESSDSPKALERALRIATSLVAQLGAEFIKRWVGISSYQFAVRATRGDTYAARTMRERASRCRWFAAARARRPSWNLGFDAFAYRIREEGTGNFCLARNGESAWNPDERPVCRGVVRY
jgi:hypothetical protein